MGSSGGDRTEPARRRRQDDRQDLVGCGVTGLQGAITDPRQLTGSDYGITRSATGWDVTRLADGLVRSYASLPQTVDGLNLQVQTGTAVTGDTFKIEVASNAALDMRAVLTDDPAGLLPAPPCPVLALDDVPALAHWLADNRALVVYHP